MSPVQYLRDYINERLTAAAAEIFTEFEKTIVQYEEVIDRQRRLLDSVWNPETNLHTKDLPQQRVFTEEEVPVEQQVWNQERKSSLDQEEPEPPQIKEEPEEICTSQEVEQLVLKQEPDTFMVTLTYEESDNSEPEPNSEQLLSHSSPVAEGLDQEGSEYVLHAELMPQNRHHKNRTNNADNSPMSESQCKTEAAEKSVSCDVCGKTFKNKSNMKKHHRIHTGNKPFSCKTCGKSFTQSDTLLVHMRTHTGEKPYSCEICGKKFSQNGSLLVHTRTHTNERPYSCVTCGKSFRHSNTLLYHMKTHTGETPYPFNTCGRGFTQSGSLTVNMKTQTGEK